MKNIVFFGLAIVLSTLFAFLILTDNELSTSDIKTLIVYAYSPGEFRDPNLVFFVRKGGIIDHPKYLYVFIASGVSWSDVPIAKDILKFSNVELMERENYGYDACAWKQVLTKFQKYFKKFILLNGSIRGPFLPNYVHDDWPQLFLRPLENSDVGLSGLTFNCDRTHIQSMLLAFNMKTLGIIYETLACYRDKNMLIDNGEIAYSNNVLKAGHNFHVMAKYFQGHDFRNVEKTKEKCKDIPVDTFSPKKYFGIDYNPFELIFFKTNRDIIPKVIERYSNWTMDVM